VRVSDLEHSFAVPSKLASPLNFQWGVKKMNTVDELAFNAIVNVIGWLSWTVTGVLMLAFLAACKPISLALDFSAAFRRA
jgi:hypothetical protein